jgi:hypothetical protein
VAETGAGVIYVDVFGLSAGGTTCYSKEHGHEVPSRANKAEHALIKKIREALPSNVPVWCEFPLSDVNAQFIDGNISYHCLNWAEDYFGKTRDRLASAPQFAPTALNGYRFALPEIKELVFLCGSENWSCESKFPFFNGEGLYDCSWFLYASPHLDRMKKSLTLQRKYTDCFATATPLMEVMTEKIGVHANKFPGDGRTAWTLFNARYMTVRGRILAVDHVEGATYYDAWNGQPLKSEIVEGKAMLSLSLDPQGLGCVVQTLPEKR